MDSLSISPSFQTGTKPRAINGNNNGNLKSFRSVVLGKDGVGKSGIWKANMSNSCMFVFILSSKLVIKQTFISPRVAESRNVLNSFSSHEVLTCKIFVQPFLCNVQFCLNAEHGKNCNITTANVRTVCDFNLITSRVKNILIHVYIQATGERSLSSIVIAVTYMCFRT